MCEIGMKVMVGPGAVDEGGKAVDAGRSGVVIGHIGGKWAIVSLNNDEGTVLVPEGRARPVDRQQRARAVVVDPSGSATALSRKDTARVRTSRGR